MRSTKTKYAKEKVKKNLKKREYYQFLEREATIPVTNAIHGMCRDQLKDNKDFKKIKKEIFQTF